MFCYVISKAKTTTIPSNKQLGRHFHSFIFIQITNGSPIVIGYVFFILIGLIRFLIRHA